MYVNVFRESKSGARRVYRRRKSDFPRFYHIISFYTFILQTRFLFYAIIIYQMYL